MSARFHAATFAKGWLSVALASSADKDLTVLNRTVAIEDYPTGVRLVSTDRYVLLTAWVPNLDTSNDAEPLVDEAPDRTVIARDTDSRGKGLLGYLLTLHNRQDSLEREHDPIELTLTYDVEMPDGNQQGTLEGMAPRYVVFDVPDTERVYLDTIGDTYPDWRHLLDGFTPVSTDTIHLSPERLDRLARLRKYADGPIAWTFAGPDKAAKVDMVASDPHVTGIVMPVRWLEEPDQTEPETEPADDTPELRDGETVLTVV